MAIEPSGVRHILHRKMVTFTKKEGTRWETKAEKRIKKKVKSKKLTHRPKKRRSRAIAVGISFTKMVGFAWTKPTDPETRKL